MSSPTPKPRSKATVFSDKHETPFERHASTTTCRILIIQEDDCASRSRTPLLQVIGEIDLITDLLASSALRSLPYGLGCTTAGTEAGDLKFSLQASSRTNGTPHTCGNAAYKSSRAYDLDTGRAQDSIASRPCRSCWHCIVQCIHIL